MSVIGALPADGLVSMTLCYEDATRPRFSLAWGEGTLLGEELLREWQKVPQLQDDSSASAPYAGVALPKVPSVSLTRIDVEKLREG